jgi:hypothetical protein
MGHPGEIIAVASASLRSGGGRDKFGFSMVHPQSVKTRRLEKRFGCVRPPERLGYMHERWNGRAVTAITEGLVEISPTAELRDICRWCNVAGQPGSTLQVLP